MIGHSRKRSELRQNGVINIHKGVMNKENSRRRRNIMMDEANRADPPNWIQQHAVYQDLMRFNVGDSAQVHAAFLVYMDLTEVRGWSDVAGVSYPELHAVLLEAREKEGDTVQMIYPLPSHRSIKHRELRCILDRGAPMLLCSVASDSSLVYQRLCDGFLTPDPPVDIKDQGRRQHRKRRLQT